MNGQRHEVKREDLSTELTTRVVVVDLYVVKVSVTMGSVKRTTDVRVVCTVLVTGLGVTLLVGVTFLRIVSVTLRVKSLLLVLTVLTDLVPKAVVQAFDVCAVAEEARAQITKSNCRRRIVVRCIMVKEDEGLETGRLPK
jgi:hypothetical protein